jgi:hypothetical protein
MIRLEAMRYIGEAGSVRVGYEKWWVNFSEYVQTTHVVHGFQTYDLEIEKWGGPWIGMRIHGQFALMMRKQLPYLC